MAYAPLSLLAGTGTIRGAQALRPYRNFVVEPVQQIIIPKSCNAAVYYRIVSSRVIVTAIFHGRREPRILAGANLTTLLQERTKAAAKQIALLLSVGSRRSLPSSN